MYKEHHFSDKLWVFFKKKNLLYLKQCCFQHYTLKKNNHALHPNVQFDLQALHTAS